MRWDVYQLWQVNLPIAIATVGLERGIVFKNLTRTVRGPLRSDVKRTLRFIAGFRRDSYATGVQTSDETP